MRTMLTIGLGLLVLSTVFPVSARAACTLTTAVKCQNYLDKWTERFPNRFEADRVHSDMLECKDNEQFNFF